MKKLVTALFSSTSQADGAVRDLKKIGFSEDDMSIISREERPGSNMYIGASYAAATNDDVTAGVRDNIITGIPGIFMGLGADGEETSPVAAFFPPDYENVRKTMTELGVASDIGKSLEKEVNRGKTLFYAEVNEEDIENVMEVMRANGAERPEIH